MQSYRRQAVNQTDHVGTLHMQVDLSNVAVRLQRNLSCQCVGHLQQEIWLYCVWQQQLQKDSVDVSDLTIRGGR